MGKPRSHKQQRAQLVWSMRASGASWVEVAAELQQRYRVNARVALRYAHGWSQQQAADEWNRRWPDEPKTLKAFSHWELWPGNTGHAPTFDNLSKLAELYQCAVRDLLADLPDFRHLDPATDPGGSRPGGKAPESGPDGRRLDRVARVSDRHDRDQWGGLSPVVVLRDPAALVRRLPDVDVAELAQVIVVWMQQLTPSVNRRELLSKLSAAFAIVTAAPLFDILDPDETHHVAGVVEDLAGFDESTLRYCAGMANHLRRQDNMLGPQLTLHSAMGHRNIAQQLAKAAPSTFQQEAISVYADLTQLVGWLCFNMGDYRSAQHYYEQARDAAHGAQNMEQVTYVLCSMSQLATWQNKPRVGIDHAMAAAT